MGSKQSTLKDATPAGAEVAETTSAYNWGKSPERVPENEKEDLSELVIQAWAYCKAKPNLLQHYRSDTEEKERRQSIAWRKRGSFIELDCGEDSFFVSNTYKTIGVADGVGGWRDHGVDPAQMSNALMANAKLFTETHRTERDPEVIMRNAYEKTVADKKVTAGSTTSCIASLAKRGDRHFLDIANLGDSGLMVVRNREMLHRVHEKVHNVTSPFQLSILPEHMKSFAYKDRVEDCARESVEIQPGDVIVMGTDGLFDNRFNSVLAAETGWIGEVNESILSKVPLIGPMLSYVWNTEEKIEYTDPQRLTQRVVGECYKTSMSKTDDTPWSRILNSMGAADARGGKVDDITLVLARVTTRERLMDEVMW
jgi:protein phosphatase PTC7